METKNMLDLNNHLHRRLALMAARKIDLVLDVGANTGQFGTSLRQAGYRGRIVSFEPMKAAFAGLQRAAAGDPLWICHNVALGDVDGTAIINISANSYSSSLLPINPRSLEIEPSIGYVGQEQIVVRRLDGLFGPIAAPGTVTYLKIDTQGYELKVLAGAAGVIDRFELIQLEASFFPVYRGEALATEVMKVLDGLGYRVVGVEPAWIDAKTFEMLQADFIFARKFKA
jgi:FkbM family methyltransferase